MGSMNLYGIPLAFWWGWLSNDFKMIKYCTLTERTHIPRCLWSIKTGYPLIRLSMLHIFLVSRNGRIWIYSLGVSEKNIHLQRLQSMCSRAIYFSSISCFVDSGSVSTQWLPVAHHNPETGGFFHLQIQTIWDLTSGEYCEKLRILTLDFFSSVNGSNWLSSKWIDYVTKIVLVPKCCKGYLSDTIIFVNKIQQNIFRDIEAMKCPYA